MFELPRLLVRCLIAASCMATGLGCRHEQAQSWASPAGGGELGKSVRAGEVAGLAHHLLHARSLGKDIGIVVATPPRYAENAEARFPVVYVFPGIGGDEWAYLAEVGRDGPPLKALFADPDNAPIVVFGNPGSSGGFGPAERALGEELVTFIDRTYRTRAEAKARSLEGFSLGGVTALTLFFQHPETFGRVVASSSACYLLASCGALRRALVSRAEPGLSVQVMLSIGALEEAKNGAVNEELARVLGVTVIRIPGADHAWGSQLKTRLGGTEFGRRVADFHLTGFR